MEKKIEFQSEKQLEDVLNQLREIEGTVEGHASLQGLNWSTSD